MKKLRNALLLAGVLAALLCITALAETQEFAQGGFYVTDKASGVTITPQTATGETVSSTSANVDGQTGYESFYPGSVKMAVTYSGSIAARENYVVLLVEGDALPTVDNAIYYICLLYTSLLLAHSLLFSLRLDANAGSFPKPLTAAEERDCLHRMAEGDLEARNTLIEHNLRPVSYTHLDVYKRQG